MQRISTNSRAALLAATLIFAAGAVAPQSALARQLVSQCTTPGEILAAQGGSAFKSGQAAASAAEEEGQMPAGAVLPVEPNFATLKPKVSFVPNVGSVNPKTGAFTYSSEAVSVGLGEFPARLHVEPSQASRGLQFGRRGDV